ncbi:hypothetical protein HYQ46_001336 [Verticillium longisporum]|nr:hypothetical protein HYQ44_012319 [Verticillium longisporum]KAG7149743.1 hypothetical protein HYQ46_001336 [Verticillium longisporum]
MAAGVPAVGGSGGKARSWRLSRSVESVSVRSSCSSEYSNGEEREGVTTADREERRALGSCSPSCWSDCRDGGASCPAGGPRRLLSRVGSFRRCEVGIADREEETPCRFAFELGKSLFACWLGREGGGGGGGGGRGGGDNGDAVGGRWENARVPGCIPSVACSSVADVGRGAAFEDRD